MTTRVASMLLLSVTFAACTYVVPTPAPPTCGDGTVDENETCDDGNDVDGDGCDTNCSPTQCGNGIITAIEECDDGNNEDGDGCNAKCVAIVCGDGNEQAGEECDDNNKLDGDGCDSNCTKTRCGNGIQTNDEACDDGNTNNGDGCDPTCTLKTETSIFIGLSENLGYDDGTPDVARLSGRPVMTIQDRTLYFADTLSVRMTNLDDPKVQTIAGRGDSWGYSDSSSNGLDARFDRIEGIATDGQTLWIADTGNHLLRSVSLVSPYPVATEAGHTTSVGMYFRSITGTGSAAEFDDLRGLAYYNGLLYMLDCDAGVLQTFDPTTKVVETIAGYAYDLQIKDGPALDARFVNPRGMRSDGAGKLYIADSNGHAIRVYDIDQKTVSTIGAPNCGHAEGAGAAMKLFFPRGIAFNGSSVFFTDPYAQTIQQLVLDTNTLTTLSGAAQDCAINCNCPLQTSTIGSYVSGIGKAARWNDPWDIIYDSETKSLLVSDAENFVIRRIK